MRRLEERASANTGSRSPRYLEAYFRALENLERKEAGLPVLPYTEEDRKDDEEFLAHTLPTYRASPGWQTEEAQRVLDEWEKDTLEKLEKGEHY
jgi:CHASE3 domain sensor protein